MNAVDPAMTSAYRAPPHNTDAEKALLGALMMNNAVFDRVADFLKPEHFADGINGLVYDAISRTIRKGSQANPVTLKTVLDGQPKMKEAGGIKYLTALTSSAVTVINVPDYAKLIFDLYRRRQIIDAAQQMMNEAFDAPPDASAADILRDGEQQLYEIADGAGVVESGLKSLAQHADDAIDIIEYAYQHRGSIIGVPTGLADLDKKLGGLWPDDLYILGGRPGMGKAQPIDSKVLLANGVWREIGALRYGDHLASIDGSKSRVVGIFPQGSKTVYRITFSDGRFADACADHLWRVKYRDWPAARVVTTKWIIEKLRFKRYHGRLWVDDFSGDFGSEKPLPIDPWVLGALLGDGGLTDGTPTISSADTHILDQLRTRLGSKFRIDHNAAYDYRIVDRSPKKRLGKKGARPNALTAEIKNLGLFGTDCFSKFIPKNYLTSNRANRLSLLQGLIDTDGWVEKSGTVRFLTTSEQLADDVVYLVRSLGGHCSIKTKRTTCSYKGKKKSGATAYVCRIRHRDPASLMTLPRKRERARTQYIPRSNIVSVKKIYSASCACIKVSHPSELYITENFVTTHNTSLLTTIAFNAGHHFATTQREDQAGRAVAIFSLEMGGAELAARILCARAAVSYEESRLGTLSQDDFERLMAAKAELADLKIYIDDTPGLTVPTMESRVRRLKREEKIGLVIVDHLGLTEPTDPTANQVQKTGQVTKGSKKMAKKLHVPVLLLSQLSRKVEDRDDKRPQLTDLRDSGNIEEDADTVMLLYREQYYLERNEPRRQVDESDGEYHNRQAAYQQALQDAHNKAEVIIPKNRHGRTGFVKLRFDTAQMSFGDLFDEQIHGAATVDQNRADLL